MLACAFRALQAAGLRRLLQTLSDPTEFINQHCLDCQRSAQQVDGSVLGETIATRDACGWLLEIALANTP